MAVVLVLIYAIFMSTWWVLMKSLMNKGVPNNLIRAVSGMGAGTLVMWSWWQGEVEKIPWQFWPWFAGTVSLNVAIAFAYVKAMQKEVASVAVHVTMLAPILAIVTSWLLGVDHWPSSLTLTGITAIASGLYVLHFNPRMHQKFLDPLRRPDALSQLISG